MFVPFIIILLPCPVLLLMLGKDDGRDGLEGGRGEGRLGIGMSS